MACRANPSTNSAVTRLLYYGTYGGATAGTLTPNGAVIFTTDTAVAQTNVSRTLPLEAVLNGVKINQNLAGAGTNAVFTGGSTVDATDIAQAIEAYVRTNGPLRMPAEICNVPRIADLSAPNNPTRNDLVRQVVGALTTQGNVFSVWTVGQTIPKSQPIPDMMSLKTETISSPKSGSTLSSSAILIPCGQRLREQCWRWDRRGDWNV